MDAQSQENLRQTESIEKSNFLTDTQKSVLDLWWGLGKGEANYSCATHLKGALHIVT